MGLRDDMTAALERRQPEARVPLWELHFHCWEQASGRHFVGWPEFDALSSKEQDGALEENVDIVMQVAREFSFAGVTIPDLPWDCFYTLPHEARLQFAQLLTRQTGRDFLVLASCGGYLGMPGSSASYQEFCYKLMDNPEEVDELARRRSETGKEQAKQLRDAGVDGVYSGADLADNRGPWYSPANMDRFIWPYMRKWAREMKELGLFAIAHTDGNIGPLLPQIADVPGIDGVQAIDPVAGMDIAAVKRDMAGRLCVCGNIDCGLLLDGSPDEVYDLTAATVESCKPGGGFVLGASNAVVLQTPIENYRALIAAWETHGEYA